MAKTPDEDFAMNTEDLLTLLSLATAFACESADAGQRPRLCRSGRPFYYPVYPVYPVVDPVLLPAVVAVRLRRQTTLSKGYRQPDRASRAAPGITAMRQAYYPYVKHAGRVASSVPAPASSR